MLNNKYVLILCAAVLYGLGGVLIRPITGTPESLGEVSSFNIGALRAAQAFIFTVLVLWPIDCWFHRRSIWSLKIKWSSWRVWASAINRAVNTLAFPTALVFASIATGYLLCNITAVGMLIWRLLLAREKAPSKWEYATAAVVLGSCFAYFAVDEHHATTVGIIAGLVGMMSFSGFFFFNDRIRQVDGPQHIQGAVLLAHLLSIPLAVLAIGLCWLLSPEGTNETHWARLWLPLRTPETWTIGYLVALGVLQGGLADWLMAKGQAKQPHLMFVAFAPTLIMLWAPLLGVITLGESMFSLRAAIPFVVAHAAIIYGSIRGAREKLAATSAPAKSPG